MEEFMKKGVLCSLLIMLLLFMGCASEPPSPEKARRLPEDGPDWIINIPPVDDESVYFVGYSEPAPQLNMVLRRAEQDARRQFAMWKASTVKVEISETVDSTSTSTTTETREVISVGGVVLKRWQDTEGGMYVLMSFPKKP
jgi:hypothetical protein